MGRVWKTWWKDENFENKFKRWNLLLINFNNYWIIKDKKSKKNRFIFHSSTLMRITWFWSLFRMAGLMELSFNPLIKFIIFILPMLLHLILETSIVSIDRWGYWLSPSNNFLFRAWFSIFYRIFRLRIYLLYIYLN